MNKAELKKGLALGLGTLMVLATIVGALAQDTTSESSKIIGPTSKVQYFFKNNWDKLRIVLAITPESRARVAVAIAENRLKLIEQSETQEELDLSSTEYARAVEVAKKYAGRVDKDATLINDIVPQITAQETRLNAIIAKFNARSAEAKKNMPNDESVKSLQKAIDQIQSRIDTRREEIANFTREQKSLNSGESTGY